MFAAWLVRGTDWRRSIVTVEVESCRRGSNYIPGDAVKIERRRHRTLWPYHDAVALRAMPEAGLLITDQY